MGRTGSYTYWKLHVHSVACTRKSQARIRLGADGLPFEDRNAVQHICFCREIDRGVHVWRFRDCREGWDWRTAIWKVSRELVELEGEIHEGFRGNPGLWL